MKYQKDIVFYIDPEIYGNMKGCVQNASPNEAFGLILGPQPKEIILDNPGKYQYHYFGEIIECIRSDQSSPVKFLMENIEELYRIIKNANEKYKRRVLSIFHSHPVGSYPSGFDVNYMEYLDDFYETVLNSSLMTKVPFKNQIWTIMDGSNFEINGFIYLEEEIQQIQLKVS